MRAFMLVPVLVVALAGCSNFTTKFESWFKPDAAERATTPAAWSRPATSEDQLTYDVASCRARAHAVIDRDRNIDSDIGRYDRAIEDEVELRTNMDQFGERKRFQQIVSDCMTALGYGEASAAEAGTTDSAVAIPRE